MSRPSKGSRLKLLGFDQSLIDQMQDFREAYLDANENTILAEALRIFIETAERLEKHGLEETEASIASKLSRGTFAATFFLASLTAIGCETVSINDI